MFFCSPALKIAELNRITKKRAFFVVKVLFVTQKYLKKYKSGAIFTLCEGRACSMSDGSK